jgi:hypothetical protein
MAVWGTLVIFVRFPLILVPLPGDPPVIPPPEGASQLYVVPGGTIPLTPLTGVIVKPLPLHTVESIGVIAGAGLTVTVNV